MPAALSSVVPFSRQKRGILVVGHGTADPVGAEETRSIARRMAELVPEVPVELGFLEVIGPSIGAALEKLSARGCVEVVSAPLLMFTAGHARQDVPEALREGAREAGLRVSRAEALGCHRLIVELSRLRRVEAVAPLAAIPAEATVLVMVGRGSSDPSAHPQLQQFTAVTLAGQKRPGRVELGFVAAARPKLAEAIVAAAEGQGGSAAPAVPVRRVLVQPHLLFRGHVEEQVQAAIARGRSLYPHIEWVAVERLGPDQRVAQALLERALSVFGRPIPAGARLPNGKKSCRQSEPIKTP